MNVEEVIVEEIQTSLKIYTEVVFCKKEADVHVLMPGLHILEVFDLTELKNSWGNVLKMICT